MYNLRSQTRTWSPDRPFVCTICGKAFVRRHEGLHSGEENLVCRKAALGRSSMSSVDSGSESALRVDPSKLGPLLPIQSDTETGGLRTALPQYGSSAFLKDQAIPSQPLPKLQDQTDLLEPLLDSSETLVELCKKNVKGIPIGGEPDCERRSRKMETSGHQSDLQGTGDAKGWSICPVHNVSTGTNVFRTVEKVHEKPQPQIWPSGCSNDIPEGTRSVAAENATLIGHVSEGCSHSHNRDENSRLSNALVYSTDSIMDVSTPTKGADRVANKHSAAHAKVEIFLESLTACRHPVNEDEDSCGSSTTADEEPQSAFAQELASDKDGNSHLSGEHEGSLSADASSVKSGSENEFDSTSEGSVLSCSQRALISRLMDEICSSFFFQVSYRSRQRGQDGQGARESSDRTEGTITSNHSNKQSSVTRRKRTHKEDEVPEDEDNGGHKRRRTQDFDDGHSTRVRYFACPFHKFDASTYGNGNEDPHLGLKYRSCGPPGWSSMGKLKEHLYRSHQTPIHCTRCWKIMKTEAALVEHARAISQCDNLPPPLRWIPREVCEKLKNRKKAFAGQTNEDTWKYIFGLLFPDCPNIPSPYYSDDITLEEQNQKDSPTSNAIATYEEYARAHLPRLFEEALETAVAKQTQPIEEGLRRALAGMVQDCHTQLAQNFLQHRSSNLSNVDGAGVQAEVLPPFYIEPLDLTEEISYINPTQISTNGQDTLQTQSDSGYASVDTLLNQDSGELHGYSSLQNNMDSFYGPTNHGYDSDGGPEIMPGPSDWAGLMGNSHNFDFFSDGLQDETI